LRTSCFFLGGGGSLASDLLVLTWEAVGGEQEPC
jgi:hypothetical protein